MPSRCKLFKSDKYQIRAKIWTSGAFIHASRRLSWYNHLRKQSSITEERSACIIYNPIKLIPQFITNTFKSVAGTVQSEKKNKEEEEFGEEEGEEEEEILRIPSNSRIKNEFWFICIMDHEMNTKELENMDQYLAVPRKSPLAVIFFSFTFSPILLRYSFQYILRVKFGELGQLDVVV